MPSNRKLMFRKRNQDLQGKGFKRRSRLRNLFYSAVLGISLAFSAGCGARSGLIEARDGDVRKPDASLVDSSVPDQARPDLKPDRGSDAKVCNFKPGLKPVCGPNWYGGQMFKNESIYYDKFGTVMERLEDHGGKPVAILQIIDSKCALLSRVKASKNQVYDEISLKLPDGSTRKIELKVDGLGVEKNKEWATVWVRPARCEDKCSPSCGGTPNTIAWTGKQGESSTYSGITTKINEINQVVTPPMGTYCPVGYKEVKFTVTSPSGSNGFIGHETSCFQAASNNSCFSIFVKYIMADVELTGGSCILSGKTVTLEIKVAQK